MAKLLDQYSTFTNTGLHSFYTPHERYTLDCGTELITQQHFKDECDIHTILKQYQQTGIIDHINNASANFEELPDQSDYQSALNIMLEADAAFSQLPSKVRDFYNNDPQTFLLAIEDPSEHDRLREWGILRPKPVEPPPVTPSAGGDPKPDEGAKK